MSEDYSKIEWKIGNDIKDEVWGLWRARLELKLKVRWKLRLVIRL